MLAVHEKIFLDCFREKNAVTLFVNLRTVDFPNYRGFLVSKWVKITTKWYWFYIYLA